VQVDVPLSEQPFLRFNASLGSETDTLLYNGDSLTLTVYSPDSRRGLGPLKATALGAHRLQIAPPRPPLLLYLPAEILPGRPLSPSALAPKLVAQLSHITLLLHKDNNALNCVICNALQTLPRLSLLSNCSTALSYTTQCDYIYVHKRSTTLPAPVHENHIFFPLARQPPVGQGPLVIQASQSHSDTPHPVEFLWTNDQPDAEAST
jgi:hypothetical protein